MLAAVFGATFRKFQCLVIKNVQLSNPIVKRCFSMEKSSYEVQHNEDQQEFTISVNDDKAFLLYQEVNPGILEYFHTEVPVKFRGKGFGSLLAEAAFNYAVTADKKLLVSCSFLQDFLKKNPKPEYTTRVLENS